MEIGQRIEKKTIFIDQNHSTIILLVTS